MCFQADLASYSVAVPHCAFTSAPWRRRICGLGPLGACLLRALRHGPPGLWLFSCGGQAPCSSSICDVGSLCLLCLRATSSLAFYILREHSAIYLFYNYSGARAAGSGWLCCFFHALSRSLDFEYRQLSSSCLCDLVGAVGRGFSRAVRWPSRQEPCSSCVLAWVTWFLLVHFVRVLRLATSLSKSLGLSILPSFDAALCLCCLSFQVGGTRARGS